MRKDFLLAKGKRNLCERKTSVFRQKPKTIIRIVLFDKIRRGIEKMPLIIAPEGEELTIKKIIADDKTMRHLQDMGLLVGEKIVLVSANGGNVIIKLKEGRLAFNRELARKIYVA